MKIIFLDIDGVLNSAEYDRQRSENDGNIDITRLPLLKELIDETKAVIVLSSSWRKLWERGVCQFEEGKEINRIFNLYGLKIYDKTPVLGSRKAEITQWIKNHPETKEYVILDDMLFGWEELAPFLVRTDGMVGRGLERSHIEKAKEILNGK